MEIPISIPLRTVNCYALRGRSGWTLVDCGFREPAGEAAWRKAFATLGIQPGDVEQIVVTHYHPDHYGAAGWLQSVTGAPVRMHGREMAVADLFWNPSGGQAQAIRDLFVRHGMPAGLAAAVEAHHREAQEGLVLPHPRLTPFAEGEPLRLGDREFIPVCTPGHTDAMVVLWCPAEQILLAADMVLVGISPNVSLMPRCAPDPLGDFLASLDRVAALPARLTCPGHRDPVPDLAARCRELKAHHAQRLERVRALVAAAGPAGATGWEVSRGLFGPQPSVHLTRFAMAEALAHLEHLAWRDRLVRDADGPVIRYRLPG